MAENKKGFVLYADLIHTVKKLPDKKAGQLLKIILSYVNDENPKVDDLIINIAFEPIKQQLKRDLQKWETIRVKRSEAGKISAEKRKQQKATNSTNVESVEQKATNSTVKDTVKVTDTVKEKVIKDNTGKQKSLHSILQNDFLKYYKWLKKEDFCWSAKEGTNLKSLITKLKFSIKNNNHEPTDENIQATFQKILKSIKDKWILEKLSPSIINSQYNEIIGKIKSSPEALREKLVREMEEAAIEHNENK